MKKLALSLIALAAIATSAHAGYTINVKGTTYNLDTTFHAKVGPGTTQTSLKLSGNSYPLLVHYLTIDRTTPGVSIRAVCATDKVAGTARTSTMAQNKSKNGLDYFAGANADFFTTSGSATNGTSKVGTPTTSCIVDGEIYKTSNSNYQFSIDAEGIARVCRLNYYTGSATIGEKVTLFKGVNVMSPNNGITLYTPKFWGTANQNDYADNCNQVTAKLVEGDKFLAGGKFRLVVTSEPTTDGDLKIPADGYVIHGRGTSKTGCNTGAKGFVGALHTGDIVEFDNIVLTPEGEAIHPRTVVSGNPKNVGEGLTLDTEGERTDASARHPRTCIGISQTGDSIIMMVIDGRIGSSVGVTTSMLADVMRYAGGYEAVNLDGGGSSTLYTEALGIRNNCSDGSERAVGNAIFAVLEAPEDKAVVSIEFADWRKSVPYLGTYRPVVYGYNKYGKLVDTDYKGYTLVCGPELGEITADGHGMTATGNGMHALKAVTDNGAEATIIIKVSKDSPIEATLPAVLLNATREWAVQLQSDVDGTVMDVSPTAFEWTSSDVAVATITPEGTVKGQTDGTCTVTGTRPGLSIPVDVTIEIPTAVTQDIAPAATTEGWTTSQTNAKVGGFSSWANGGYTLDYTITSTRAPKITLTRKINMWSHPMAVKVGLDMDNSNANINSMILTVKAADNTRTVSSTISSISAENAEYTFPLADIIDLDDVAVYPIEFTSLAFNPSGSTSTQYSLQLSGIKAEYDKNTISAIDLTKSDTPEGLPFGLDANGNISLAGTATAVTLTDMSGRTVAAATDADALATSALPKGVYILTATIDGTTHTAKIAL